MSKIHKIMEQLDSMYLLEKDWDSYGGLPPTEAALSAAKFLIHETYDYFSSIPCFIGPIPGGGVQIEWENYPRELEVEVEPDGCKFNYLLIEGANLPIRVSKETHGLSMEQMINFIGDNNF